MNFLTVMGHVTAYQVPQLAFYTLFAFLLGLSVVFAGRTSSADDERDDDE